MGTPHTIRNPFALDDVSDLPEEIKRELSIRRTDDLEDHIIQLPKYKEGEANIDEIIVALYREHKVITTRRFIQNKLYRMIMKKLISNVKGKRSYTSIS